MQLFQSIRPGQGIAMALLGLALLSACGGGGDDAGSAPPVNVAPRIAISDSNAPALSAEAFQAVVAGGGAFGGVAGDASPSSNAPQALKTAVAAAQRFKPTVVRSQATSTETVPCSGGGSITITVTVANPGAGVQAGDTLRFVFNACNEAGAVINGTLSMAVLGFSGTATNSVLTTEATLTDLQTTAMGVTERSNGTVRLVIDDSSAAATVLTVSSAGLSTQRLAGNQVLATRTLTDMTLREVVDNASGQVTSTAALVATGNFPRLGEGSFQVETLQPVITAGGALYPNSGRIRVTGANGATILITVQPTGLRLDIDRDGNGTVDATRNLTWAEVDDLVDG